MASKYPSFFNLCNEWTDFFYSTEIENILIPILNELEDEKEYYPEDCNIFKCFYMTPFKNINVVMVDKKPYNNGTATGLSFDIKLGNPLNPLLQTIYKELDLEGFYPVKDGNLEFWAKQGILLLNFSLTVDSSNYANSHKNLWSSFSEKVIKKISEKDFVIWVFLNEESTENCELKEYINKNHIVLEVSQKSFIGSGIFKNINKELTKKGLNKISW
jgi:uracil-DNA glycosylase